MISQSENNSIEKIGICPNEKCKKECTEIYFKPEEEKNFDKIEVKENGQRIGYKYEGKTTRINPYIDGGTFVICRNCCLYTFYPRKKKEITN